MSMNRFMHPRNPYCNPPDFTQLALAYPELSSVGKLDLNGRVRLDFQHPQTLRTLTASLLHRDFGLRVHLPVGKLVPTLPLRLNYILWLEDILKFATESSTSPIPPVITGIDIGCGAACIYPLLGARTNNWRMYALEANADSVEFARANVAANHMAARIAIVLQSEPVASAPGLRIFDALLHELERQQNDVNVDSTLPALPSAVADSPIADFCMCNPPFFAAADRATAAANRSGHRPAPRVRLACTADNQQAATDELSTAGGELAFIEQIIRESGELRGRIRVYTTMCGHKSTALAAARLLATLGVENVGRTEFCQGRTTRWALAWSFDPSVKLAKVPATGPTCGRGASAAHQSNSSKRGQPFTYAIRASDAELPMLQLQQRLEAILADIGVQLVERQHVSADVWMGRVVAQSNAWANQRRRRRELQRAAAALSLQDQQRDQPIDDDSAMDAVAASPASTAAGSSNGDDDSFYNDEGQQQADDDDNPSFVKRARLVQTEETSSAADSSGASTTASASLLCVQLSLLRSTAGVQLEMQYESGSSGRDGAYQLMQFIQNRWK